MTKFHEQAASARRLDAVSLATHAALEAAYRVGSAVAHELMAHWDRYENEVPR